MAPVRMRLFALLVLLACGAANAGDQPAQAASNVPPADAPGRVLGDLKLVPAKTVFPPASAEARAAVKLRVEQDKSTGNTGNGFLVAIDGWTPNGRVTAVLVGPKGESVDVIPFAQPMQIGPAGTATFLVPYQLKGLSPGEWKLVIDGASGEHSANVQIPTADPPDAQHAAQHKDADSNAPAAPAAPAKNPPTASSTRVVSAANA